MVATERLAKADKSPEPNTGAMSHRLELTTASKQLYTKLE
jgi:hypothetical protein